MLRKLGCLFLTFLLLPFSQLQADQIVLPVPGTMVRLSPAYEPPLLKGIKVHPENPFRFEFVLDRGDQKSTVGADRDPPFLKEESKKLIKYFLAALTTPEKDLWVNLSPYEKDRIVPESFGQTEMGRDLLAQDYILKQITASLVYPEGDIGKRFWKKVYESAGNKNVPVNTFNKVWIMPDKAEVYENTKTGTAYIVRSSLKVLTEQDYLATNKNTTVGADLVSARHAGRTQGPPLRNTDNSKIIRDLVIPELTKEINQGQNFAQLRQVYNSLILATWYKKKIKDSILSQVYADKNKIKGTEYDQSIISPPLVGGARGGVRSQGQKDESPLPNPPHDGGGKNDVEAIYARYLQAFKKGAYNYIKDTDLPNGRTVPTKYFSGGARFDMAMMTTTEELSDLHLSQAVIVQANMEQAIFKEPDAAMSHDESMHKLLLEAMLWYMNRDPELSQQMVVAHHEEDLVRKFFLGRKVLNVAPEEISFSDILLEQNIMTDMRQKGIDARALAPVNKHPLWEKESFYQGVVEDMHMINADTFDDIVIARLFDPDYWETTVGKQLGQTVEQRRALYPRIAKELKRVLRDKGRLFMLSMDGNPYLFEALRHEGFKVFSLKLDKNNQLFGTLLINDKTIIEYGNGVGRTDFGSNQAMLSLADSMAWGDAKEDAGVYFRLKAFLDKDDLKDLQQYDPQQRAQLIALWLKVRWAKAFPTDHWRLLESVRSIIVNYLLKNTLLTHRERNEGAIGEFAKFGMPRFQAEMLLHWAEDVFNGKSDARFTFHQWAVASHVGDAQNAVDKFGVIVGLNEEQKNELIQYLLGQSERLYRDAEEQQKFDAIWLAVKYKWSEDSFKRFMNEHMMTHIDPEARQILRQEALEDLPMQGRERLYTRQQIADMANDAGVLWNRWEWIKARQPAIERMAAPFNGVEARKRAIIFGRLLELNLAQQKDVESYLLGALERVFVDNTEQQKFDAVWLAVKYGWTGESLVRFVQNKIIFHIDPKAAGFLRREVPDHLRIFRSEKSGGFSDGEIFAMAHDAGLLYETRWEVKHINQESQHVMQVIEEKLAKSVPLTRAPKIEPEVTQRIQQAEQKADLFFEDLHALSTLPPAQFVEELLQKMVIQEPNFERILSGQAALPDNWQDDVAAFAKRLDQRWQAWGADGISMQQRFGSIYSVMALRIGADLFATYEQAVLTHAWFFAFVSAAPPEAMVEALHMITSSHIIHLRLHGMHPYSDKLFERPVSLDVDTLYGRKGRSVGVLRNYLEAFKPLRSKVFDQRFEYDFLWGLVMGSDPSPLDPRYAENHSNDQVNVLKQGKSDDEFFRNSLREAVEQLDIDPREFELLLLEALAISDQEWEAMGYVSPYKIKMGHEISDFYIAAAQKKHVLPTGPVSLMSPDPGLLEFRGVFLKNYNKVFEGRESLRDYYIESWSALYPSLAGIKDRAQTADDKAVSESSWLDQIIKDPKIDKISEGVHVRRITFLNTALVMEIWLSDTRQHGIDAVVVNEGFPSAKKKEFRNIPRRLVFDNSAGIEKRKSMVYTLMDFLAGEILVQRIAANHKASRELEIQHKDEYLDEKVSADLQGLIGFGKFIKTIVYMIFGKTGLMYENLLNTKSRFLKAVLRLNDTDFLKQKPQLGRTYQVVFREQYYGKISISMDDRDQFYVVLIEQMYGRPLWRRIPIAQYDHLSDIIKVTLDSIEQEIGQTAVPGQGVDRAMVQGQGADRIRRGLLVSIASSLSFSPQAAVIEFPTYDEERVTGQVPGYVQSVIGRWFPRYKIILTQGGDQILWDERTKTLRFNRERFEGMNDDQLFAALAADTAYYGVKLFAKDNDALMQMGFIGAETIARAKKMLVFDHLVSDGKIPVTSTMQEEQLLSKAFLALIEQRHKLVDFEGYSLEKATLEKPLVDNNGFLQQRVVSIALENLNTRLKKRVLAKVVMDLQSGKNKVTFMPMEDSAQISSIDSKRGGIDLTSDKMDLKLKSDGGAIRFKMDPAQLKALQEAPGLIPSIVNMRTLPAGQEGINILKLFLGVQAP